MTLHCNVTSHWLGTYTKGALTQVNLAAIEATLWLPGARLTKAYDVTIQRYCKSHVKIQESKMHILQWVQNFL